MLLADHEIRKYCTVLAFMPNGKPMIEPFSEGVSGDGIISYGLSSSGYDIRLCGKKILVFKPSYGEAINPKRFNDPEYRKRMFDELTDLEVGQPIVIPAAPGYILGQTVEYFHMPAGVKGHCLGKSTLARCGVLINVTPAESDWNGTLTVEVANLAPCPTTIFAYEGIAQMEFTLLHEIPEKGYTARGGKYNEQRDVTPARVL